MANKTPLDAFKREAKKLKKATGISHTDALEQVARLRGYAHYHEAFKVLSRQADAHPEDTHAMAIQKIADEKGWKVWRASHDPV